MNAPARPSRAIDDLMDRASRALEATDYFEAERLSLRALERAWIAADFERMARITLPLQEARRQRRHLAADAGPVAVISGPLPRPSEMRPGCYLLVPPHIGVEARDVRAGAERRRVPVIVLTREPLTRAGKWPIVAVGVGPRTPTSVRVYVDPVEGLPNAAWFMGVSELLGDAAIAKVEPGPAAWRVDDLLHFLDAHPDHEKLHQALAQACREAANEPLPQRPRRRGIDDPHSF